MMGALRHAAHLGLSGIALTAAFELGACQPFAIKTPPAMIELEQKGDYAYRAMTPDGVVLGVRVVDNGKADAAFWTQAVVLHMKELSAYALLTTADVTSADGSPGKELRFGHDESGKPYAYVVRIFVKGRWLFVVEAGGTKEEMERGRATLDWAMSSLQLK
jgi:hypothetical protein